MKIGDKICFGSYEWRILDVQNDIALIVTECIVEQRHIVTLMKKSLNLTLESENI